ncbi:hypothetical protein K461DRAFT_280114 [Myriangium duriaei CBS 260.36]|uniref:Borealin N-terminal domain-containing protein n=1 Tax=Myriangium duriaei CBS 260.36 TaxID=1168546 RepID=A0A9P4IWQ5_9PEZI|nr:hypothetical protein K461DRAFT_280114 [Myriangium duriaei CBS 260.36]
MATTPEQASRHDFSMGTTTITEARKQMLMDNLQLEITERARKLRAQYALQAQALRTRLEMRVNRIPHSLRHANMQDLLDKYSQPQKTVTITSPHKASYPMLSTTAATSRGLKRTSDAMPDKENERPAGDLENPKKRAKTTAPNSTVPVKPTARTASRKPGPSSVLSPKSHNSRTYPISPLKAASPIKPASPVKESTLPKPSSRVNLTATSKQTRPASRQTKRPAAQTDSGLTATNRPSSGSDASSGTTIMKRVAPTMTATAKKVAPAATKSRTAGIKSALSSLTGSKRGAATKKAAAVTAPTTTTANSTTTVGGRTLRKRG